MNHDDSHGHGPDSFWSKYVFSLDHKVIGLQYLITSLVFLLIGFILMMLMRWQLAYPGTPIPLIGRFLSPTLAPNGVMTDMQSPRSPRRAYSSG